MGFQKTPAAVALAITLIIWFIPTPEGVAANAWHLLAIFIGIIAGIIGKAMPIGAMAILAMTIVALLQVTVPEIDPKTNLPFKNPHVQAVKDALSPLNSTLI